MSVTRVQWKSAPSTAEASGGRYSVTLDAAPSEGQLVLVTLTTRRSADASSVTISGFTKIFERISESADLTYRKAIAQFYRIAGPSDSATITSSDWFDTRTDGVIVAEVFPALSWVYLGNASNDTTTTSNVTSITTGTTASLAAVPKLLVATAAVKALSSSFTGLSFTNGFSDQVVHQPSNNITGSAYVVDETAGTKTSTVSWASPTTNDGAIACITAFQYTPESRRVTITDLKAPNDANSAVANATNVQVKLWINKEDTGIPDELFTDATITSGTMEVTFTSSVSVGTPVLGVAKWTVTGTDYFFPIDTTLQEVV